MEDFGKSFLSGISFSEGVLNRSLRNFGLFGSNTIRKYIIEGDDLVRYSCKGTVDAFDFDCIGPIDRNVIASKGRKGLKSQFIKQSSKSIEYFNLGNSNSKMMDYQGAISNYTKAIKLYPKFKEAYFNRGIQRFKIADWQGAVSAYH